MAAFEQALGDNDIAVLAQLADRLKEAAGGYGFPWITDAVKALKDSAKARDDVDILAAKVEELAGLCRRARATQPSV